jgi:hypothetical protein
MNSWCYASPSYQAIYEILVVPGEPFRLMEFATKVLNDHLTPPQLIDVIAVFGMGSPMHGLQLLKRCLRVWHRPFLRK